MTMYDDVRAFHERLGIKPRMATPTPLDRLPNHAGLERLRHLREELDELNVAAVAGDLGAQADALVDLVYIALGTALMMGLPWEQIWAAVHRANMRKLPAPGVTKQVVKPAGWRDPVEDIKALIARAREAEGAEVTW